MGNLHAWLREFREAYSYVRDPHGWEARIRYAEWLKQRPRPAIFSIDGGRSFIVHPARAGEMRKRLAPMLAQTGASLFGSPSYSSMVFESLYAVEAPPPDGGWPDVVVPERPRLRP